MVSWVVAKLLLNIPVRNAGKHACIPYIRCLTSQVPIEDKHAPKVVGARRGARISANYIDLNFTDHINAFKTKSNWELFRALCVLRVCSYDSVVDNCMKIYTTVQKILGRRLTESLVGATFYDHFVGGTDRDSLQKTVNRYHLSGVRGMIAVAIEETTTDQDKESPYDLNRGKITDCVHLSSELESEPLMQLKITSLIQTELLARLTELCVAGNVSVDEIALDMEGNKTGKNLRESFSEEELQHYENAIRRLYDIAKLKGVKVLVDAEYNNINPGLSLLTLAMMVIFNKEQPMIWNTYQCYLKEAYNAIHHDLELARAMGLCFGAKIVRGAYIQFEKAYSDVHNTPTPVNATYQDTNDMYNKVVSAMIDHTVEMKGRCQIMVASHNEESVRKAILKLELLSVPPDSGNVVFGQLMGMCDQVSYPLGQNSYSVYKSVPYGTMDDTLPYLVRRAVENRSILQSVKKERGLLQKECRRRLLPFRHSSAP